MQYLPNPPNYTPTPEEIKEECAKFQEGWSKTEEQKKAGSNKTTPVDFERNTINSRPPRNTGIKSADG